MAPLARCGLIIYYTFFILSALDMSFIIKRYTNLRLYLYVGSRSDESIRRREGWQDGGAAFR